MRKDLRLGLGIGALALLFAVTFLVVRNHTENQAQEQLEHELVVVVGEPSGTPPAANLPAATGNVGGVTPPTIVLPPLQPVDQPRATAQPDPFARQAMRTPEAPMPAPGGGRADRANWDLLLNEGRGVSSAALNRVADPTISSPGEPPAVLPTERRATPAYSTGAGRPYTIRTGDTFSSLAKEQYGAEKYYLQIERANPNVNTLRLKPGQQIILPELTLDGRTSRTAARDNDDRPVGRNEYRVDAGDSLYRISVKLYGTPRMMDSLYEVNRDTIGSDPDRLRLGMILRLPSEPGGSK